MNTPQEIEKYCPLERSSMQQEHGLNEELGDLSWNEGHGVI